MHRLPLFICLSLTWYISTDVKAQLYNHTAEGTKQLEQRGHESALAWAEANQFPTHIRQADGRAMGIVRVEEQWPVFFTTHNRAAGIHTNTSQLHNEFNAGLKLTGVGLFIGIWDEGAVRDNHQELDFRVNLKDLGSFSNHATHVAGTLIASGIEAEATGMAPGAQISSFNWNFHITEMQTEANRGLLFSNHSYGRIAGWHLLTIEPDETEWYWFGDPRVSEEEDYVFGYYDQDAFLFDHVTHGNPYLLPVVSAGNERDDSGPETGMYRALDSQGRWVLQDIETRPITADGGFGGYDTITSFALSKNVLTVGSIGINASNEAILSPFSSTGPTDDGRIKPDIMGLGENLFSATAQNTSAYARYSGTSMATPNVTGSLVLLQQLAHQLRNQPILAATLKGLVAHTATDLGQKGPDYNHGWGLLNTAAAANHIMAAFRRPELIQEAQLKNGVVSSIELQLSEPGPVKVTLSWTDLPGTVYTNAVDTSQEPEKLNNRTPLLVNDLDMTLVHTETGTIYQPYTLLAETPDSPALPGDNDLDPIEQILVDEAPAGQYTILLTHEGPLENEEAQPYSLLLSGLESVHSPISVDSVFIQSSIGQVKLKWHTNFESTAGRFVIERAELSSSLVSGTQSISYLPIAEIASIGSALSGESYEFMDQVYLQGAYQYRVLFVDDINNLRMLIAVVNADIPAPEGFSIVSVFPNPTKGKVQIVVDLPADMEFTHTVFDLLGRQVYTSTYNPRGAGRHFVNLNTTHWSTGIYFVQIQSNNQSLVRKMVVMR